MVDLLTADFFASRSLSPTFVENHEKTLAKRFFFRVFRVFRGAPYRSSLTSTASIPAARIASIPTSVSS